LLHPHCQLWFITSDIANVFYYTHTIMMLRPLDVQDRATTFLADRSSAANIVTEAGAYQIGMRTNCSNLKARNFQDWVTRIVLPAVRKDSGYITGKEKVATGEMAEDELFPVGHRKLIAAPEMMATMVPTPAQRLHRYLPRDDRHG
jgi:prophage antirepressor-like protein